MAKFGCVPLGGVEDALEFEKIKKLRRNIMAFHACICTGRH